MPKERCLIHTIKLVDMYCEDDDEVGCTTCMALNHRSCRQVYSIPDDIDVLYNTTDIVNMKRFLQNREQRFNNIEEQKDEALRDLKLSRGKADVTIDNAKRELIAHVEKLARQAKQRVEKTFQSTKAQIGKEKNVANKLKKMSANLKTFEGNKSQQFVSMKIANRKIKEADEIEKTLNFNEVVKISFDVDSSIHMLSRNIKTFGEVICSKGTKHYTVKTIRDMNIKVKGDKSKCYIFGSCLSGDGRLLSTDNSNKNLKRVNIETMTVDSVCSFDNNPFCVCCKRYDEAVVTFYSPRFIQFVSLGTHLKPTRKLNMKHNCMGIAYKDDKLYITDNAQTLYIHDMAGNELHKIATDNSGNDLFSRSRDISFIESPQSIMIVVDYDRGVIILNDQYQRIAGFCDAGWKNATSVCTDESRSIFGCGWNSYNVIQIGYDGKKIDDVVDESNGIEKPESLCFDSRRCRLIVAQFRSNIVKIFQLK